MKDFVSNRWAAVIPLAVSMFVGGAVFTLHGHPSTGLVWMSLASAAAFWTSRRSNRSIGQMLNDFEAEPARVAVPVPVAMPARKAVL